MVRAGPRGVAKRVTSYLSSTGIADTAFIGPEAEFFIFDGVNYEVSPHRVGYELTSAEAAWSTGDDANLYGLPNQGHKVPYKGGYFPLPPLDQHQDLRSEMTAVMKAAGLIIEVQHHEVGTAGQAEIDLEFGPLLDMADGITLYKYIVKEVARANGKTATFMPKPLFGDNGSGMHVHQSLWKGGETLMYDANGYAGLSDLARYYIGGLLKHAASVLAFAAPTTNSYKRLVPGYEAPVNLVMSSRNRSAAVRIPMYSHSPKAKRLEFRCPDPSANPYLAFPAMVMAGLDGIQNKIEPPDAGRQEHLRLAVRGESRHRVGARLAGRVDRCAAQRSRVPARRWRVQRVADRGLHRAEGRGDPGAGAPAGADRVRDVLLDLIPCRFPRLPPTLGARAPTDGPPVIGRRRPVPPRLGLGASVAGRSRGAPWPGCRARARAW